MGQITETERLIIRRTRKARKAAGLKAATVAAALHITVPEYRRYEDEEIIPASLLFTFCEITRCSPSYLAIGKSDKAEARRTAEILAPPNRCGEPCVFGRFWCRSDCTHIPT